MGGDLSRDLTKEFAAQRERLRRAVEDGERLYRTLHVPDGPTLADDNRVQGILSLELSDALGFVDRLFAIAVAAADAAEVNGWFSEREEITVTRPEIASLARALISSVEPREGMVTVYDSDGLYLGCMGIETWNGLLEERIGPDQ